MALAAWESHTKRVNNLLDKLSDAQLTAQVAPGRNSGTYLLGHLTAVNDYMLPLFGLGERLYPDLEQVFINTPDGAVADKHPAAELRTYWHNVSNTLTGHFNNMTAEDWFARHTSVSAEDFAREPHRNKLNVLLNRTNHQSYHLGQLAFLDRK